MLRHFLDVLRDYECTLEEFQHFPLYKRYLFSLSGYVMDKLIEQELNKEEFDQEIKRCLTVEENFKKVEEDLRKYAIELGYDNSKRGLDEYQHAHPLVLAASYGRIDYLKMAEPCDFAWHNCGDI